MKGILKNGIQIVWETIVEDPTCWWANQVLKLEFNLADSVKLGDFFLKSSRADFDTKTKITTGNQ
jgi:hypothetical protein